MKENTSPGWQQAAFRTLLWLLDPVPEEAARAYSRLLEQLARRLAKYLHFRLDDRLVAELLAEQALERTAEYIYGSLSKPLSHDENTSGIVNEVPPVASPEEYERARKSIQPMAFLFGVNLSVGVVKEVRQPKYLDEDDLHHYVATASLTSTTGDERLNRIRRVLKNLNPTDRHIIKKYYAFADEKNRRSREQLANKLGVSVEALNRRAVRIRRRIDAELSDEKRAEAEFTAYFQESVYPAQWSTLLAYMHLSEALPLVDSDSKRRFGTGGKIEKRTAEKRVVIERGARILVVPESPSLEFNPRQIGFVWLEDYHCAEFRFRVRGGAGDSMPDKHIAVRVAFYVSPVLVADIAFSLNLGEPSNLIPITSVTAKPYQRVFVSYSHRDSGIADQLEKAYRVLGIEYLRDVRTLRSGEKWAPSLLQRIDESEVFQLLWSESAKRSINVRREWRHALSLRRGFFIRPVYWKLPMPRPPSQLADIHFAYLDLRRKQYLR